MPHASPLWTLSHVLDSSSKPTTRLLHPVRSPLFKQPQSTGRKASESTFCWRSHQAAAPPAHLPFLDKVILEDCYASEQRAHHYGKWITASRLNKQAAQMTCMFCCQQAKVF